MLLECMFLESLYVYIRKSLKIICIYVMRRVSVPHTQRVKRPRVSGMYTLYYTYINSYKPSRPHSAEGESPRDSSPFAKREKRNTGERRW